jgi:hypothetical protein
MLHQPKKMRGNQVRQNKLNYRRIADCGSQHTERWCAWSNRRHAGDPSSPKTQLIQKPKHNAAFNGRLGVGPLRTVELRQPTLGRLVSKPAVTTGLSITVHRTLGCFV